MKEKTSFLSREEREERKRALSTLSFPYPRVRRGQKDLMTAVARTLHKGGALLLSAPTGTGKTVSVLYPALRSLAKGDVEKIFYLTPKGTAMRAVTELVTAWGARGADIRAIAIIAKERICRRGASCRSTSQSCPLSFSKREELLRAARALWDKGCRAVTEKEIVETAREFRVCPYELSLTYAEGADLVIGDYNYLFDLDIYFRRFFDEGGEYAFLVDEAHELAERAPSMYSWEWNSDDFQKLLVNFSENSKEYITINAILERFSAVFLPFLREAHTYGQGAESYRFIEERCFPDEGRQLFLDLGKELDGLRKHEGIPPAVRDCLRSAYYEVLSITERLSYYGKRHTTFLLEKGGYLSVKALCLDPSEILLSRTAKGKATVFFSATLSPMDYYATVLTGASDTSALSVPSPFLETQMAVAVADTVSVRLRAREETLAATVDLIRRAVLLRTGNYLVFCPSFRYMNALADLFLKMTPSVRVLRQERSMSPGDRNRFLLEFREHPTSSLVGFCVSGGIFGESVDLAGTRLIGAVVVGVALPSISAEREALAAYYEERYEAGREFAYVYPGIHRILQAAGRVIRRKDDRGVILFIDDRFSEPVYRKILPTHFRGLRFVGNGASLSHFFGEFWRGVDKEKTKTEMEKIHEVSDRS